jgi:hypothetical protein
MGHGLFEYCLNLCGYMDMHQAMIYYEVGNLTIVHEFYEHDLNSLFILSLDWALNPRP